MPPYNYLHTLALAGALMAGISSSAKTFPDRNTCDAACASYFLQEDDAISAARLQGERAAHLVDITASLLWVDMYLQNHSLYRSSKEEGMIGERP